MTILNKLYGLIPRALLAIGVVGFMWGSSEAATSYDVHNLPQMYLDTSISSTATNGITLAALKRNGDTVTFPTTTGGVLRIRSGNRTEDIYFATGAVNSVTKKVTLYGVIRDLCFNQTKTFTTCSDGKYFSRGSIVELTNDARLFNLKLNEDRVNTLTGSGQITSNQTNQAVIDFNTVTTAERDTFSFFNGGNVIFNSTIGAPQYYDGSSWLTFAASTGSIINSTESVRGVVEIADTGSIISASGTGTTGAENVLSARYTTGSGGVANYGEIPYINDSGNLEPDMLGSGTLSTNTVLVGDTAEQAEWRDASTLFADEISIEEINTSTLNVSFAATTAEKIIRKHTITGSTIQAGDIYKIEAFGMNEARGADGTFRVRLGSLTGTTLALFNVTNTVGGLNYYLDSNIVFRSAGASASIIGHSTYTEASSVKFTGSGITTPITKDTTADLNLVLTFKNGTSDASSEADIHNFIVTRKRRAN